MSVRTRGIRRQDRAGGQVAYVARTQAGNVAFEVVLDPRLYPLAMHSKILKWLERGLLDPVDAPLELTPGAESRPLHGIALAKFPHDDPYGLNGGG